MSLLIPAGTRRCFNVVLRLILGRDVEHPIFTVDTTLFISTLVKQPISMLKRRQISTLKQRRISRLKQRLFSTLKHRPFSTLKQRHISTLKQRNISTLIRFNKIECLFNIVVRCCFNVISFCICLLGCVGDFTSFFRSLLSSTKFNWGKSFSR